MSAASIAFTPTGCAITGHPSLEEWAAKYTEALMLGSASTWSRADLLQFAEDEMPYGDEFMQFVPVTRVSEGTLRNDRRRVKRFPVDHPLRRFASTLSTSHMDSVASLPDDLAESVLVQSEAEGLDREWVRARVREIKQTPVALKATMTVIVRAGVLCPTVELPTWIIDGQSFDVTLRDKAA